MYCMQGKVRYSEVDENCELTWDALIDYFQDCCVAQSEEMGIGITYLSDRRKAWVLNAWQICVDRLPVLNEEIIIETWPYAMKGLFGYRNFRMTDKEGNCLAYANSIWVFVDLDTGRPLKIPADIIEKYTYDEPLKMKEIERKIAFAKEYELGNSIHVPSFFIDTNQHMNNGKYFLLACEYLPEDFEIGEVYIEYKKSAILGDYMQAQIAREEDNWFVRLVDASGVTYATVKFVKKQEGKI